MDLLRNNRPRVVVTGYGAVTALGDADTMWDALKAGCSGITQLETIPAEHLNVRIAAEVRHFDPGAIIPRKEARRMGRASQFAVVAAHQAAQCAQLSEAEREQIDGERFGVVIGTSLGSYEMGEDTAHRYRESHKRPSPTTMMNALPNMPAHYVSRAWQAYGYFSAPASACAAGTHSIGVAADQIRLGRADIMIAGGVEAILLDYIVASFDSMTAIATAYNERPAAASRPFDAQRQGFVVAEGGAVVVLESLAHALKRGAPIYGEVLGYGVSSEAYHPAAMNPDGMGAIRAMKAALADAHLDPEAIDSINAHGTSTPLNDATETLAIKRVFGDHAYQMPVNSTKSMLGHALAASGAIEFIASLHALREQTLHPTINYETPDPDCDLDYVPNVAREVPGLRTILSNSFGLGGHNASIVISAL